MNFLNVKNLSYRYDRRKTDGIQNINFSIKKGEILALVGPSGSGKTTTLKCISGELSASGIEFTEDVSISLINQNSQLEEEQTVFENLESKILYIADEPQRENQIRTILSLLEITNEIHSPVSTLSGGQKQRLILGQALITNPTLILLDEPFANLDKNLRELLLHELWDLFKEKDITVIWVTHNTEEALKYSHRIVLLNYGELQQVGTPRELFFKPQNTFVANFFGENNILPAKKINLETYSFLGREIISDIQLEHEDFLVCLRPHFFSLSESSKLKAKVVHSYFLGAYQLIELNYHGQPIFIETTSLQNFQIGQKLAFDFDPAHIWILDH